MTDELDPAIAEALGRSDTWADLPPALGDEIVRAVAAEPVQLGLSRRRRSVPGWMTAAAAIVAIAGGAAIIAQFADEDADVVATEASLTGTDLSPAATATATFEPTPAGLRIVLDTDGLPGAEPDEMYEAWISDGQRRVSAGTFHLRGGDGPIELWAGTDDPIFHLLSVTIEPIDGVAESSGRVVLVGEFRLANAVDDQYEG